MRSLIWRENSNVINTTGWTTNRMEGVHARIDLDEAALERQPFAGGLFKIDAGVSGLGAVPFIVD